MAAWTSSYRIWGDFAESEEVGVPSSGLLQKKHRETRNRTRLEAMSAVDDNEAAGVAEATNAIVAGELQVFPTSAAVRRLSGTSFQLAALAFAFPTPAAAGSSLSLSPFSPDAIAAASSPPQPAFSVAALGADDG